MERIYEPQPQPGISRGETALVSFSMERRTAKGAFRFAEETSWVPFQGLDDLVMSLEEELERRDPRLEAFRRLRSRRSEKRERLAAYTPYPRPQHTVTIRVYYRQHFSMQGELCLGGGKRVCFRSALELMFLLRQAAEDYWAKEESDQTVS
ncbi:MAG TPA: hypothetical protein IAC82_13680 [Candidatus Merdivicinus intestinigallinarum]|nr:hypothetical protein [Candidatus Merdivicinus intestinigallinarum]